MHCYWLLCGRNAINAMWLNGRIGVLTLVSIVSVFDYCTVVVWENVLNLKKFTLRFLGVTGRDLPFYY